jgi:hypothetical protein
MFASLDPLNESSVIAGFDEGIDRSIRETFRMNFVRYKRDARAMQSLMQEGAFSFRVGSYSMRVRFNSFSRRRRKPADDDLNSTVAPDAMSRSFGA